MNLTEKPKYPKILLPHLSYRYRMNVDVLVRKYPQLMVARMVEGSINDYILQTESGNQVLSDKVFKNSMANLSMNLAGGLFDVKSDVHLGFLPISKNATKAWNGWRVNKNICESPNSYVFYETCLGLCFYVKDIHNRTFPFFRHFESQNDRDVYAQQVTALNRNNNQVADADYVGAFESKKKNVEVRPIIRVHHSPSFANYWHVTLDTYRPNERTYVRSTEKQNSADKSMFKFLKQDLRQHCKINMSPLYKIDGKYFYNFIYYYLMRLLKRL